MGATSAKALLNCRTTEFCAVEIHINNAETIIFFIYNPKYLLLKMRFRELGSQKLKSPDIFTRGFLITENNTTSRKASFLYH